MTPEEYIRDNFHADDRLAVITINKSGVRQRFATAKEIASSRFQAWLHSENARDRNIYIGMNPLRPEAHTRTKRDIAAIRHIYLDIDHDGLKARVEIESDPLLPRPSYVLDTSPGKYQIIWKADGFSVSEAEQLQKAMAIRYGADRAATDATRVLRIPGFLNWKYDPPCEVRAEQFSDRIRHPSDFHIDNHPPLPTFPHRSSPSKPTGTISQSERDWAETCHRLYCGDDPAIVRNWLEQSRPDKSNPRYYAELTVYRAMEKLRHRKAAPGEVGRQQAVNTAFHHSL